MIVAHNFIVPRHAGIHYYAEVTTYEVAITLL
jgi:hypothetical protein